MTQVTSNSLYVHVRLSPARIAAIVGTTAALSLLMLVGTFVEDVLSAAPYRARLIALQFTLAHENNVAVWFASMLLLTVALAMLVCFLIDRRLSRGPAERLLNYGWLIMALLFAGLSLDELGSLHERLGELRALEDAPLRVRSLPTWVGLLLVPILLVCGLLIALAIVKLRRNPLSLSLMAVGFLLFASVPLQEALEAFVRSADGQRHVALTLLEEGTELFASCFLLASALWFAHKRAAAPDAKYSVSTISIQLPHVVALQVLLALGMLLVAVVVAAMINLDGRRGNPLNWFPTAVSAVVALIATYAAIQTGRARGTGSGGVFWAMAVLHLILSADHGSAHRFTEQIFAGTPLVRWALDAALGTTILACAGLLIARTQRGAVRVLLLAWAALLFVPVLYGESRPWLGFAAYTLAIPALLMMLEGQGAAFADQRRQSVISVSP